jgi:two-component system response regulator VicR
LDPRTVLIVEDDHMIVDIVEYNLKKEGYAVKTAFDGKTGLDKAIAEKPDMVLLDVMLPYMDGFEVCRKLRQVSEVPVIMLTAREEEADKIAGLELGADDYITKPFSMKELMARIKANMRRLAGLLSPEPQAESMADIAVGELMISPSRLEVTKNGKPLDLSLRELELIRRLAANPDTVYSRERLVEEVWGYAPYGDLRTVDVAMRRLREKIEDDPANPRYIMTKRGAGYYMARP